MVLHPPPLTIPPHQMGGDTFLQNNTIAHTVLKQVSAGLGFSPDLCRPIRISYAILIFQVAILKNPKKGIVEINFNNVLYLTYPKHSHFNV